MSILLRDLVKRYGQHTVVDHLSLEIAEGEFFVLLGSSGSGKTTVLHMIAGLTPVDSGQVCLHGRDVTCLPPQKRRVGLVFQHYALFEHMTVADNVEFGLRVQRVPQPERQRRCAELLDLVGLTGLERRMPRQLSGGQQQRVALARALATRPDVLLLDEPLGALDAKIRTELRRSLKAIQRELGVTTILVTHDQAEAFELADRLGVMSEGRLIEVGGPQLLYEQPQTDFVAKFLGTANLLVGERTADGVRVGDAQLGLDSEAGQFEPGQRVRVLFRPEHVVIATTPDRLNCPALGQAVVESLTYAGSGERVRLRLPTRPGVWPIQPPLGFGRASVPIDAWREIAASQQTPVAVGDRVWLGVSRVHALPHPGLRIGLLADASPAGLGATAMAREITARAQAQLVALSAPLLTEGAEQAPLVVAKLSGTAAAGAEPPARAVEARHPCADAVRHLAAGPPCDLVVAGCAEELPALVERLLQHGEHHLLVVPAAASFPRRALVCVAAGEPGKEDVLFSGRLLRHLEAEATLLYVLPDGSAEATRNRAEGFLSAGVRTLGTLGVAATWQIRPSPVVPTILKTMQEGGHDLLVIGAPLPTPAGRIVLGEVVGQLVRRSVWPLLIVRFSNIVAG